MKRQTIKLIIVLVTLFSILIAIQWKQYGAWAIPISLAIPTISSIIGIALARWTEK